MTDLPTDALTEGRPDPATRPDPAGAPRALVVVDVQKDFCEGGALAVDGGAAVAGAITEHVAAHADEYAAVVATRDWHVDPGAHFSDDPDFRVSWPPHCVAGQDGAEPHPAFDAGLAQETFRKGQYDDGYSGFQGTAPDGRTLGAWLRSHAVTAVDVVGLATDHCVRATALDAVREGFSTRVLLGLVAGVSAEASGAAVEEMRRAGVEPVG